MKRPLLEICCFSLASAQVAQEAGVERIEFCSPRFTGGGSPTLEELIAYKKLIGTKTNVMLHPRQGNYVYTKSEIEIILEQLNWVKELKFNGVVFGCNTLNKQIDVVNTQLLVEASKGLEIAFHKAFDECENLERTLDDLISLGIHRVLTSGGKKTALDGIENLKKLNERANNKLIIMAGGSLRANNIQQFLNVGIKEVHSSALLNGNDVADKDEIVSMKTQCTNFNA
jgi:copper homeostasis protein